MDISQAFPSKWLQRSDLNGDTVVTIESVDSPVDMGDGDYKPVLHVEGHKPFPLNKTNCNSISAMYGDETDHWPGKQIVLFETTTDFQGKRVGCIRVKPVNPISPKAETTYQGALRYITSLQVKLNSPEDIAKVLVRLEEQMQAKLLTESEYKELCGLAEKLPQLPSSDINSDLPFMWIAPLLLSLPF